MIRPFIFFLLGAMTIHLYYQLSTNKDDLHIHDFVVE